MLIITYEMYYAFMKILPGVLSHHHCGEGSSVLIGSVCFQLPVGTHHLTLVPESKFGLWLFQDVDIWPIMVNG